ncbi:MAG: SufE family protein, partial [Crocinitomicaceae bacterium]|nr:SufE family protein [Crocinitomicaceae bacterium]
MNAELQSRQEEIVEEFSFYEDWMEKYEQLIEMGKELDALPDESRMDEHLIRGCQSRVWLLASKDENQS